MGNDIAIRVWGGRGGVYTPNSKSQAMEIDSHHGVIRVMQIVWQASHACMHTGHMHA